MKGGKSMDDKYILSTLVKTKQILDLVQKKEMITLKEVQSTFNLKKTTAFRLLYSLVELDFLIKKDHHYFLKNNFLPTVNVQNINWTAVPILKPTVDEFQLSAYVGIIFEDQIVITQVIPTARHLEDYQRLGESLPLNTTAMGKCALAFMTDKRRTQLFEKANFVSKTKFTLVDLFSLGQNLKIIREQGYALDDEEKQMDFRCLAVPLCKENKLVAVIGLSGTLTELKRQNIGKMVKSLKRESQRLELLLL